MASCRSCSPSRNSPLRIFSVSLSTTAAERDCRGIGADCFGVTVSMIGVEICKRQETGNFASPRPTLKQSRNEIQIIKPMHNLQLSSTGLTISALKIPDDLHFSARRIMQAQLALITLGSNLKPYGLKKPCGIKANGARHHKKTLTMGVDVSSCIQYT